MDSPPSLPSLPRRPLRPRDRSRVVCHRCHARKVKCDLLARINSHGSFSNCSNCEKRGEPCHRRGASSQITEPNRRPQESAAPPVEPNRQHLSPSPATTPPITLTPSATPSYFEHNETRRHTTHRSRLEADDRGYIGESSIMSYQMSTQGPLTSDEAASMLGSYPISSGRQILAATGADQLPPTSMIEASADAYFKHLYHRIPVLDHEDVSTSSQSTLLLQAVCFVGAFLRHPKLPNPLQETEAFYTKAKYMFFVDYEHRPVPILKTLCFLSLWNVRPPAVVTIDCSWNWLGMAMRLALQMGLHRESTHSQSTTPVCCRKIAWYLYAQDKILSACFGRPQMLRSQDFDLRPLSGDDFEESQREQGRLFILYADLATVYAKMLDLQYSDIESPFDQVLSVLFDLKMWVLNISSDFRLADDRGNKIYYREFYEFIICYLSCIITYFHICGSYFQPAVASRISLVASSCIISLYQEMDYRDDINYLTAINNWSMMAAALAQLNNISRENQRSNIVENSADSSSAQELEIILKILKQRASKFPGSKALTLKIERLKQGVFAQSNNSHAPSPLAVGRNLANPARTTYAIVSRVHELFPFPKSLTPRLALLDTMESEVLVDGYIDPFPDWTMDNLLGIDDLGIGLFA